MALVPMRCGAVRATLVAGAATGLLASCSIGTADPAPVRTHHVTARSAVGVGPQPDALIAAYGSVWAADYGGTHVQRIDPATGKVVANIAVGAAPIWLEADGRWLCRELRRRSERRAVMSVSVWVSDYHDGVVRRLDPSTLDTTARIRVGTNPDAVYSDGTSIWVDDDGSASSTASRSAPRASGPAGGAAP